MDARDFLPRGYMEKLRCKRSKQISCRVLRSNTRILKERKKTAQKYYFKSIYAHLETTNIDFCPIFTLSPREPLSRSRGFLRRRQIFAALNEVWRARKKNQ